MVVVLILGTLIFAYSRARQLKDPQTPKVASRMTNEQRFQRTMTTQQRINRYFHGAVVPKLRNCWTRVQGRGTIEIEHTYTRDASGKWVVEKLAVGKSTLPRGQDAVALQCMQNSVRGTSFPAEGDESNNALPCLADPDLGLALSKARTLAGPRGVVLVAGSLFLVGAVKGILEGVAVRSGGGA